MNFLKIEKSYGLYNFIKENSGLIHYFNLMV
jgi:hypothetical protein